MGIKIQDQKIGSFVFKNIQELFLKKWIMCKVTGSLKERQDTLLESFSEAWSLTLYSFAFFHLLIGKAILANLKLPVFSTVTSSDDS